MDKSTYQALSSSVDLLQRRFDLALHVLQPDSAPTLASTTSLFSDTTSETPSTPANISTKEEAEPSTMLDSLLNMISSMTEPEPPASTEPVETNEEKKNESEE
jgi:hypothetical protein